MEVMGKWVAEFYLRRQQNPRVDASSPLFSALKLVDSGYDCVKLKINVVLRDISNSLIRGNINEEMLDLLEILEKLLLSQEPSSAVTMASSSSYLKSAYCWTAVECTVRFMSPENASDGLFIDALERIWEKKVGMLKERNSDLVTLELLKWEIDLMKAFVEPEIYKKIRESNVRFIAISHLNELLKEQWALLGCSSLESEARKRFLKRKEDATDAGVQELERRNNGEKANDAEEEADGVNKANEQERGRSLNIGDEAVAKELKDFLLEIQGLIDPSTSQREGLNNPVDHSLNVTPQADKTNRIETGGTSSGRVRPYLPTHKPLNVSPLKKGRLAGPQRPRRKMKLWTPEETQVLREGVKKYGRAWKAIKNSNPDVFADRTEVDLKDKWRNLVGRQ